MKLLVGEVCGTYSSMAIAQSLINDSRSFEFNPLPDDCYEFRVKDEAGARAALSGCDHITKVIR